MLTDADIAGLTRWRQDRHRTPEVSGDESATAAAVCAALVPLAPDGLITGLGGHGVAAIFGHTGETVMIRAELDALPIQEAAGVAHGSEFPGVAHLCGHDGHMAILLGVARGLSRRRPPRGRVVLLFQPAEETGAGAAAVLADPAFAPLRPDWAFALHNLPGLPLGQVVTAPGPFNCASVGLRIMLSGRTAHASQPETGVSPAPAIARLIPALTALGPGGALDAGFRLVTVTHASLGTPAFGIAPGAGEVWATLRSLTDDGMAGLRAAAETLAQAQATEGLTVALSWHDDFAACTNHPDATAHILAATPAQIAQTPFRWSEDFGRFATPQTRAAMFVIGAGVGSPALHNPDYDFPDALIAPGASIFTRIIQRILG